MTHTEDKLHLLVVEDDLAIARLHNEFLSRSGYQITVCHDGLTAFEAFSAAPYDYDLLLTDLQMPGMNGRALCEAVLTIRTHMPIMVVSGYCIAEVIQSLNQLGVHKVLAKPAALAEILREIKTALEWYTTRCINNESANCLDH